MNFGQKALQILKTFAPTLALAVGGPVGPFAAAALHAVFGTVDDKGAEAAILGATPEQLAALQKADRDFETHMADLGVTKDKMVFDDIANARAREISVRDNTPRILAYVVTTGFFLVLGYMLKYGTPPTGSEAFLVMLGSLGTAWAGIMTYYYGSSAGSAAAHQAVNKIAATK
jgi:heme A synthase